MGRVKNAKGQWVSSIMETGDRPISVIVASPQEGDILRSSRLGRKGLAPCRWTLCSRCGHGRWVQWPAEVARQTGWNLYSYLRRNGFPKDRYRLLCFNCNRGAYANGGVCPHQTRGVVASE